MADPYAPFGYMPPQLGRNMRPAPQPPLDIPPLQMPTAEGGLMPQSEAEAADIAEGVGWLRGMATHGAPFALAGPMAGGARVLANLATRFPRLATTLTGGAALTGQSSAAGPQKPQQKAAPNAPKPAAQPSVDPQLQRLLESDPVLRALQKQIDAHDAIANAPAGNDPASGSYPKSSRDGARTRSADLMKEFNARLSELSRANLPFDQAYPWLAQNRGLVSFLGPAAVGAAARTAGNMLSRAVSSPWERAMRSADRALERGNEKAYEHFMSRAARFEPGQPGRVARAAHALTPPVAGGFTGAELAMLPYQHNLTNAPLGSPQRAEAEEMTKMQNMLPRAAFGFGIGALGGATGGHMPNIRPGYRPPSPAPIPPAPPPPTGGPRTGALPPPAAPSPTASPPAPPPTPGPVPPPPTSGLGAMWPPPPSPVPGPPPGLASIRSPRPSGPSPTDAPPMPQSAVGAPARPMPEGAYQDRGGRWRVGNRWISEP